MRKIKLHKDGHLSFYNDVNKLAPKTETPIKCPVTGKACHRLCAWFSVRSERVSAEGHGKIAHCKDTCIGAIEKGYTYL